MNWRLKSRVQNACAATPVLQEELYYFLQRTLGSLRHAPDPLPMLEACASMIRDLAGKGVDVRGKRVMEIGTGRRLEIPLGLFLCGADSVLTVDLHPILREELVLSSIAAMSAHRDMVIKIFDGIASASQIEEGLDALIAARSLGEVLRRGKIEYRARFDAANPDLSVGQVDIHMSYTVFEHVPGDVLLGMLRSCHSLLSRDGVALHHIDPSDHFSHEDKSITPVNFLQFSPEEWQKLAGNHFAYHNRLRAPQYATIYRDANHEILQWDPYTEKRSQQMIENGFPIDATFQSMNAVDLATVVLRVMSRPVR